MENYPVEVRGNNLNMAGEDDDARRCVCRTNCCCRKRHEFRSVLYPVVHAMNLL